MSGGYQQFAQVVQQEVEAFEQALLFERVAQQRATMRGYHTLLCTLFHQTRDGPYTFALAAAQCSWQFANAKEYLLHHALEEEHHWRWVLDDLCNTQYAGPSVLATPAHATAEAYIAFNNHVSMRLLVARLSTASVLVAIGARFGDQYGQLFMTQSHSARSILGLWLVQDKAEMRSSNAVSWLWREMLSL